VTPAARPNPKPPVEARWPLRKDDTISVTRFKTWIRDPYAIYAEKILGLTALEDLDMAIGPREYGNALHKALEGLLKNALSGFTQLDFIKEDIRLEALAEAVITDFHARAARGMKNVMGEQRGELKLDDLGITLVGYPDRVDEGGFKSVPKGGVDELSYKRLRSTGKGYESRSVIERGTKSKEPFLAPDHIAKAREIMARLIEQARDESTGYASQIRRKWANIYGDYDLLARREEWSQLSGEDGNG